MEKQRKYNLVVLILSWISVVFCIAEVCISIVEAMPNAKYGPAYFILTYIFSGITAVSLFNAIWLTVRHKKYPFGGLSLALAIIQTVIFLALPANSMNVFFGNNVGRAIRLAEFIVGIIALIIAIVKLVYSILLFSGFHKGKFKIQGAIAENKLQEVSTVKSKKKKKGEMAQIDPDNYEEFDLDHKSYLYLFGAFFIIFEKKCFGWRYIGKSKEGEITRKGKVQVFKYAWFSRAHELKTTKLFKFVEVLSNIFIVISNIFTSFILLIAILVILLFIFKATGAAIGIIVSYFALVAFNVLLALLGKLIFKVQKIRENNPPASFDYLDSAVDEEREVMEQIKHEKEKQEIIEEVKMANQPKQSESSEAEKLRLIKEYKKLLKDGTITQKEFDAKKKELLK